MAFLVFAVALSVLTFARFRGEPRRLSNGLLLVAASVTWLLVALSGLNRLDVRVEAVALIVLAVTTFLGLLGFVSAMAFNGAVVAHREGLRPATALPLALAVTVAAGCALLGVVVAVLEHHTLPLWILAILWTAVLYAVALGVQLVAFTLHALLYGRVTPPTGAASVIVLGCGLTSDGSVTPLLASRLDRAKAVYDAELAHGNAPVLVVSGGQGTDETVPEAVAMQRYLTQEGVDSDSIEVESSSTTTHENLVFSRKLLNDIGAAAEPMVVVTSDFHVLRTAAYTRDLGYDARVTGSRTARYYVPTAFLREFAAILRRYRRANAVLAGTLLLAVVVLQNVN